MIELFFTLTLGFSVVHISNAKPKPNLIYLLADDYGWANVGFHAVSAPPLHVEICLLSYSSSSVTRSYCVCVCVCV